MCLRQPTIAEEGRGDNMDETEDIFEGGGDNMLIKGGGNNDKSGGDKAGSKSGGGNNWNRNEFEIENK